MWTGIVAAVVVLLGGSIISHADDKKGEFDFEAYLKSTQPGPEHKCLEPLVGSWTFTSKFWMEPGKPPMESKGTSEHKFVMGGRYLEDVVHGDYFGLPFEGRGLTGYDKIQGKYVGTWIDNMGTGISTSVGSADASGKVLTFEREEFDPMTHKKGKSKDVVRILSDDKHIMEMYKPGPDGKEMKVMELTYTRKK
jgi:hypothetical protein